MSEAILHREPAIINREHQRCEHVTKPRPAWNEGEAGRRRYYAYIVNALVINDKAKLDDGRVIQRDLKGNYSLWANELQIIVTLPKAQAMIDYLTTGKVCQPAPKPVINVELKPNGRQYKGIYYRSTHTKHWKAEISHNNRKIFLGQHATQEEAARAYDAYVIANGLNRPLNFPQEAVNTALDNVEWVNVQLEDVA